MMTFKGFCQIQKYPGPRHWSLKKLEPSVVIPTKGSKRVNAYFGNSGKVSLPSKPVEVEDTVDAGDTFNAGVLAMLAKTRDAVKKAKSAAWTRTH